MTAADEIFGDDFTLEDDSAMDRADLAALTGFSPKEITKLVGEGMPCIPGGRGGVTRFRPAEVVQWLVHRADEEGNTLNGAKRRERSAMARRRELEVAALEGRTVDLETVTKTINDEIARLQDQLMSIPARLIVPPEIRDAVRAEILASLSRLTLRERFK